jgi:long-subunit acyl-CoA synthetase (AMP-forming)
VRSDALMSGYDLSKETGAALRDGCYRSGDLPRTAATDQIQRSRVRDELLQSELGDYQVSPSRQSQVSSAVGSSATATGST